MNINPAAYPRRILLAVTGLSPQIVTETLYALAAAPAAPHFVPTEIHLLTTATGKDLARNALLHPDGGQFHALLADYPQIGRPAFDESRIHVIRSADGTPLPDIRTPEENAAAADAITALVAELTGDDNGALHVSIAGGRKTMGFYLGYAFSLYARPQDSLSHVLVSSPFESHPEFFFPPATPRRLTTRDNKYIDTADAEVTLAEIPVVRLRHGLPEDLRLGSAGFGETVEALQQSFAPPHLFIDLARKRTICGEREVSLSPMLIAWLAYWGQSVLDGKPEQSWRELDRDLFMALYEKVVGRDAEALENIRNRWTNGGEPAKLFQENTSDLKTKLKIQLKAIESPYILSNVKKSIHEKNSSGRKVKKPASYFFLGLPREAIEII